MTDDEVARVAAIGDRELRLRAATQGVSTAQRTMTELARMRRALIQELHSEGWSYAQIAAAAGLSRGRIHQVRHQGPAPEGAFFGTGHVRIATPLKAQERGARPVVAAEDVAASQRLGELVRSMGFEIGYEQLSRMGRIELNRDGLVVICGPRTSKDVASVLATDPDLRFTEENGTWAISDNRTGEVHTSGADDAGRPYDVGYLGRVARPDGAGTVLVLAGLHTSGALGVVQFLTSDLADLHRQTRDRRFSLLVRVTSDPDSHEPTDVDLLSPVYLHDEA